jgi:hypothetical protein
MVKYLIQVMGPRRYKIRCKWWYKPFRKILLDEEYRNIDDVQQAIDELRDKEDGE